MGVGVFLAAAAVCGGCASAQNASVDAMADNAQPVDASRDAPIDAPVLGFHVEPETSWQGQAPIALGTAGNRICFLTRAGGAFDATNEVKVYLSGATWYIAGSGTVLAAARCITWMNGGLVASSAYDWAQGQSPIAMGPEANRLCGLTRMAGQFRGSGEVIRTFVETATWKLGGDSQQTGVAASAQCLAWPASTALSPLTERSWEQGQAAQDLGTGNRACVLTLISGSFRGFGEQVQITEQGASWQLTGASQQAGVAARSRCLGY